MMTCLECPYNSEWCQHRSRMDDDSGMPASRLGGIVALWKQKADEHIEKQMKNPFNDYDYACERQKIKKGDPNYGRPLEGSLTEYRGKKAAKHISGEIVELCHIIAELGTAQPDNTYTITFGALFDAYITISNKVVGILIRARRQNLLLFEGEMLYQRQDEGVVITLLTLPERE
ncbi:hypothetical protein ScPMuIL_014061 [Solemya velum]